MSIDTLSVCVELDHPDFSGDSCGHAAAEALRRLANEIDGVRREDLYVKNVVAHDGAVVGLATFRFDSKVREAEEARIRRKYIEGQIDSLSTEVITLILDKACDVQSYSHEPRWARLNALVECIVRGHVTLEDIDYFINGAKT